MTIFRRNLLLTGVAGLLICGALAFLAVWLVQASIVKPPFPFQLVAILLALILGSFSIAEVPLMVVALRRLTAEKAGNRRAVCGLNLLYISFAAVYGAPVTLLTGSSIWGLALSALGLVRFLTSLAFVQEPRPE
jgi:hypothetical protein